MDLMNFFFQHPKGGGTLWFKKKVIWPWLVKICTIEKICNSRSLLYVTKSPFLCAADFLFRHTISYVAVR